MNKHYHFVVKVDKPEIDMVKQILENGLPDISLDSDDEHLGKFLKYICVSVLRSIQVFEEPS